MSEGDGMVTDGDRDRAFALVRQAEADAKWLPRQPYPLVVYRIASALAEERQKARAPFLALAQELATVATHHHATVAGDAYADSADRIVAVLEGTYR